MKNGRSTLFALLGVLVIALVASSCSGEPGPAFTAKFSGCNFADVTVARVEMMQGGTVIASGDGPLVNGVASFPLYDVDTEDVWFPPLGVTLTGRAYCFAGSLEESLPSDYWQANITNFVQRQESAYAQVSLLHENFSHKN